ncbi:hypothetical protein V8G54_023132 [Vigna mungo]|uniref:Uncharacterized protein n=1 Tax=Vigna mungo TaxID=3915 RepID=A0AAQ3RS97_VIGMU
MVEKRWVARNEKPKSPSSFREEKRPVERVGHNHAVVSENTFEDRKKIKPSNAIPATRICVPAPPRGPELVSVLSPCSLSPPARLPVVDSRICQNSAIYIIIVTL